MEANFTPEYFLDEVRDGFYIPSIMKRVWAEHITILTNIDKVCRKYDIRWFAGWGTLLGAVRHGGFIPWDDDIDILMFRKDYNRFMEIAENELPGDYEVKSVWNNSSVYSDLLRVNNTKGEELNGEFLEKHNGCFYGCGVDIFPIDIIDGSDEDKSLLQKKLRFLEYIKSADLDGLKNLKKKKIKEAEETGLIIDVNKSSANECMKIWIKLIDELSVKYNDYNQLLKESEGKTRKPIAVLANGWKNSGKYYKPEWFADTCLMPFENTELPVPIDWDNVLKVHFGDYKVPVRGGSNHAYPYFNPSRQKLLKDAPELKYVPKKGEIRNGKIVSCPEELDEMKKISAGTIVFLPVSIGDWNYMGPIYEYYKSIGDYNCVVMPIPYMLRKNSRGFMDAVWDGDEFVSNGVPITRFDNFDFGNPKPSAIFISDPYDSYNGGYSVHPFFYSCNMRKMTDSLIYVQCFEVDLTKLDNTVKWTCEYFIEQPGIAAADALILTDESTADGYWKIIDEWKHSTEA